MEHQILLTPNELEVIFDAVRHYGFETDSIFSSDPENELATNVQSILTKVKELNPKVNLPWEYY